MTVCVQHLASNQAANIHPSTCIITAYLAQYVPVAALNVMKQIGPRRARAIEAGEGGYDAKKLTAKMNWWAVLGLQKHHGQHAAADERKQR